MITAAIRELARLLESSDDEQDMALWDALEIALARHEAVEDAAAHAKLAEYEATEREGWDAYQAR